MSFCLCSLVSPASFTLTFPSAPAGARSPTQLVAKHPLLDKNWQISAGGWLLSLSLPAPPEPAPACLVAEEEAATSDRVPGSEVCTQCSHSSVHSTHSPACRGRHITLKSSLIGFQTLNELFHFRLIGI